MSNARPTADDVARAIICAARITGADPIRVANRTKVRGGPNGNVGIARARVYVAMALKEIFGLHDTACSRMAGVSPLSWASHLGEIRHRLAMGEAKWFTPSAVLLVKNAVLLVKDIAAEAPAPQPPPPKPAKIIPRNIPALPAVIRPKTVSRALDLEMSVGEAEQQRRDRLRRLGANVSGNLLGDPPPSRSALAGHTPWKPKFASKPSAVGRPKGSDEDE